MVSLKMVWGPDWCRVVGGVPERAAAMVAYETEEEVTALGRAKLARYTRGFDTARGERAVGASSSLLPCTQPITTCRWNEKENHRGRGNDKEVWCEGEGTEGRKERRGDKEVDGHLLMVGLSR